MMNISLNRINAQEVLSVQELQNQEAIYMSDTVPALSQRQQRLSVTSYGHFFVKFISCTFTTVEGAVAADTGIDYLRGKLLDGSNMRALFNDYIPFGLWAVPGRRKSLAASGSDSAVAHILFPWEYMFPVNSDILLDVKNDATLQPNSYSVAFIGIRVRTGGGN